MEKNIPKSLWFESLDCITDFQRHDTIEYIPKADAHKRELILCNGIKELQKQIKHREEDHPLFMGVDFGSEKDQSVVVYMRKLSDDVFQVEHMIYGEFKPSGDLCGYNGCQEMIKNEADYLRHLKYYHGRKD
jgi:hypothetical protein